MHNFLNQFGTDLAEMVRTRHLSTISLNVKKPMIANSTPLLNYLLNTLTKSMNSIFFVGDDVALLQAYINSLAIFMDEPSKFERLISDREPDSARRNRMIERLVGKKLLTLHMSDLFDFAYDDKEVTDDLFNTLIQEIELRRNILHIPDIEVAFTRRDSDNSRPYSGMWFFFGNRIKSRLPFIAPMTWINYSKYIERGPMPMIARFCTPILFSPRPRDIPEFHLQQFAPDRLFTF